MADLYNGVPLPAGQAPALRLLAALHRLVLAGQAPELARYYPSVGGDQPPEGAWAVAEQTLRAHAADLGVVLRRGVQTNEPGRSAVLFGVLLWTADRYRRPIRLLEIGASAGLNLLAENFAYRSSGALLGDPDSPVVFEGPWVDAPVPDPADAQTYLTVIDRRGCDVAPIDATSADGQLALLSYIWPDEPKRLARMRAALGVAERFPPVVDASPAGALAPTASWPSARARPSSSSGSRSSPSTSRTRTGTTSPTPWSGPAQRATEETPLVWARMEPADRSPPGLPGHRHLLARAVRRPSWPARATTVLPSAGPGSRPRPRPAASRRGRILQLLHELEPDVPRGLHEHDPTTAEGPAHLGRSPQHGVPFDLPVEIVGEQGRMEKAVVGQVDGVLVEGPGEQGDHDRPEKDVGSLAAVPGHPVAHLGARRPGRSPRRRRGRTP